jgi:hypothetical protein
VQVRSHVIDVIRGSRFLRRVRLTELRVNKMPPQYGHLNRNGSGRSLIRAGPAVIVQRGGG